MLYELRNCGIFFISGSRQTKPKNKIWNFPSLSGSAASQTERWGGGRGGIKKKYCRFLIFRFWNIFCKYQALFFELTIWITWGTCQYVGLVQVGGPWRVTYFICLFHVSEHVDHVRNVFELFFFLENGLPGPQPASQPIMENSLLFSFSYLTASLFIHSLLVFQYNNFWGTLIILE